MRTKSLALVALLVSASLVAPAAMAAESSSDQAAVQADQQASSNAAGSAYAGSNIAFDTEQNAVVDYRVDGETLIESTTVESESGAESNGSVGLDVALTAVTNLSGSTVALESQSDAQASVSTDSSASLTAHDNEHGILVVHSNEESQYVTANVSSSADVESESDARVHVTNEDGTEGSFIVAGEGNVTVNEDGNVSAWLDSDSQLVFRAYADGRSDADEEQESLIAEGKATAEVYIMSQDGETVNDTVTYDGETSVSVEERADGSLTMTAERSSSEGTVIITSVSNETLDTSGDLDVSVDGEAAAEASSYSDLEAATDDGDSSKYMVRQSSNASANADVLVGVNHFSSREVKMADATNSNADASSSGGVPGFELTTGLGALAGVSFLAFRHR